MVFIFVMSTDLGNSHNSLGLLVRALHSLTPSFFDSLSIYQIEKMNEALRKLGHLSEYMVLTLFAVRAIQFGRPTLKASAFVGAMLLSVVYALSDELHQRFVGSRSPSMRDVMIDSSGSVICMLGILAWFYFKGVERRLRERIDPNSAFKEPVEDKAELDARHALL
jgi:VanZ family protein